MIDIKDSGHIVKTKGGRLGRTFHKKGLVNGKVPVFLATKTDETHGVLFPVEFSEKGTLFSPQDLTGVGFID